MPQRSNLTLQQGDDWTATVVVQNADGTPANLTGYTAKAPILTIPAATAQVVLQMGLSIASPNIVLALTHAQTQTLGGSYVWELQTTSNTGTVTTLMAGTFNVIPQITQ